MRNEPWGLPFNETEIVAKFVAKYGECVYNDEKHEYKVKGRILTSITNKKKEVVPPFDAEEISARMARKTGRKQADILEEWKAVGDCGTMVHELLEAVVMHGQIKRPTDHSKYSMIAHKRFLQYRERGLTARMIEKLPGYYIPVACEMRVWTDKYAGTIDLLCYDARNECYVIVDWKSNSKTFEESDYSKQYLKPLKAPFQEYQSSKIEEYSIQLESYASMLESVGIPVGQGLIVHAYFDDFDNYCDAYETIDLRNLCKNWLELPTIQL